MILQALYDYYERKASELPKQGYADKEIPFTIVINEKGDFVNLEDNREVSPDNPKKLVSKRFLVPQEKARSGKKSFQIANCLWDHYGYVLCQAKTDFKSEADKKKGEEQARLQFESFKTLVAKIANDTQDVAVEAVDKFLNKNDEIEKAKNCELYSDVLKIKGCNLGFRLNSQNFLVCQNQAVQQWITNQEEQDTGYVQQGVCLITGKKGNIARLHSQIPGIGAQSAPLSSINNDAYCSYGKDKAYNFPTSPDAVFKYTTALKDLLKQGSNNRLRFSSTTIVFWSKDPSKFEDDLNLLIGADDLDDPNNADAVRDLYESVNKGSLDYIDNSNLFYVLGLSPNVKRIVIRFWYVGTVANFAQRIKNWLDDVKIVRSNSDKGYVQYGLPRLIKSLQRNRSGGKNDDPRDQVLYDMAIKAIFSGLNLPLALYQAALQRTQDRYKFVGRVALIKAYINRKYRQASNIEERIKMQLDEQEQNIGYCLGRLFAIYEKLQVDSAGGSLNSTICDTYYSSASRTPQFVYPILNRLHNYHLRKLDSKPKQIYFERLIGNVMHYINSFPAHLNLEEQGFFAIGYYHQKEDLYAKKANKQQEE